MPKIALPLKKFNETSELAPEQIVALQKEARKRGQDSANVGGEELTSSRVADIQTSYGEFAQYYIDGFNASFDEAKQALRKAKYNSAMKIRARVRKKSRISAPIQEPNNLISWSDIKERKESNIPFEEILPMLDEAQQGVFQVLFQLPDNELKQNPAHGSLAPQKTKIEIIQEKIHITIKDLKENTVNQLCEIDSYKKIIYNALQDLTKLHSDITNLQYDADIAITESKIKYFKDKIDSCEITPVPDALLSNLTEQQEILKKIRSGETILDDLFKPKKKRSHGKKQSNCIKKSEAKKLQTTQEKVAVLQQKINIKMQQLKYQIGNDNKKNQNKYLKIKNDILNLSKLGVNVVNLQNECEIVITESKIKYFKNNLANLQESPKRYLLLTNIQRAEGYLKALYRAANKNPIVGLEQPAVVVAQSPLRALNEVSALLRSTEELKLPDHLAEQNAPILTQLSLTKVTQSAKSPVKENPDLMLNHRSINRELFP